MADTHEEQLLSELLSTLARDDERLEATHLELRVMAMLDATPAPRFRAMVENAGDCVVPTC